MTHDPRAVLSLTISIEREIALYKKYLALMEEEQRSVTKFDANAIEALTEKRNSLCNQLDEARLKRDELVMRIAQCDVPMKLSEMVHRFCNREEKRKLTPLVDTLRTMVQSAQRASQEFSQVVNFSLGMVSSTLSIIWSATQEVQRSYTTQGVVKESFHPASAFRTGTLTQA